VEFLSQYINVIIAALIILAVLLVILMVWRTFAGRVRGRRGQRIGISEYHELDKMRRLVLVRRDNVEHLILIGGPQDVLIEQSIAGPGLTSFADDDNRPIPMRPAPRAPGFGERKSPALRPLDREDPPMPPVRNRDLDRP
jgi:hypothetical protein